MAPGPPDTLSGHPGDLPKAAGDWPNLNFITYHACIQPALFPYDSLQEIKSGKLREGVPDISWTTEYALLVAPFRNTYAETTWASSVVTFPTVAAHIMGQLMKFMGPGPDCVRFRFGMVRVAPMADRRLLAVSDSRGVAEEIRLPRTHPGCQAEDFGPQFCEAVRRQWN